MNNIGFLFDMDGVIVPNHEYHYLAWQETGKKYGAKIDEIFYMEKMNGRTLAELVKVVFEGRITGDDILKVSNEKEAIYRELYRPHLAPTPGLMDFLEESKDRGVPMVVGTSAPEENVIFTLDGLGIRNYFKGVVDASMVKKGKPEPEVYLKAAEMIQRDPTRCIVFEDAISGIQAGKNAKAKVIGLATSHAREELNADLIIDNFEDLKWSEIEKLMS
ncbi:MAG: HAD family phosphatase [Cyclobacteriaceae bacterium]